MKRIKVLLLGVAVYISVGEIAGAGTQSAGRLAQVKSLHRTAVADILSGRQRGDRVGDALKDAFFRQYPLHRCDGCAVGPLTYDTILRVTETELKDAKVTVKIDCSPKSCHVQFHRVLDKGWLDFGDTLVQKSMEPNMYEFSCSCTEQKQTLDCHDDCSTSFKCDPHKSTIK